MRGRPYFLATATVPVMAAALWGDGICGGQVVVAREETRLSRSGGTYTA